MAGPHQLAPIARLRRQPFRARRTLPLRDVPLLLFFKRHRQRPHRLLRHRVMPFPNPERQRKLQRAVPVFTVKIQLTHHRNVAVRCRVELPVHAKVVHQIPPAVARAHKPTAHPRKPATGRHGQRPPVLPGQQRLAPGKIHSPRRVACSASVQMRSQQRIHLQPRQQFFISLNLDRNKNHGVVRVANNLLRQAVAAFGIAVHIAHPQRIGMDVLEGRDQVALFFVDKRLPIRQQELHVPHLRPVDGGVVNLVQNAVRTRKPDPAGGRVGRPHRILQARSPSRLHARRAKCFALLHKPAVLRLIAHRPVPGFRFSFYLRPRHGGSRAQPSYLSMCLKPKGFFPGPSLSAQMMHSNNFPEPLQHLPASMYRRIWCIQRQNRIQRM